MSAITACRVRLSSPLGPVAHAGLVLNRYLAEQSPDNSEGKEQAFTAVYELARDSLRAGHELYRRAYERMHPATPPTPDRLTFGVRTPDGGRMIVGLGGHHVLETGLTLHHTYGVPYIPGTALKGLASHYCHSVWGAADATFRGGKEPGAAFRILFGTHDEGGLIHFHDAWIQPDSVKNDCLRDDVLTPHHTKYYMEGGENPPSDFDSPVPVTFASVVGTFTVTLSAASGDWPPDQQRQWLARAEKLLLAALSEWGIGGKTSSGYGRLVSAEG